MIHAWLPPANPLIGVATLELAEAWALRCALSPALDEGFYSYTLPCFTLEERLQPAFSSLSSSRVGRSLNASAHILA